MALKNKTQISQRTVFAGSFKELPKQLIDLSKFNTSCGLRTNEKSKFANVDILTFYEVYHFPQGVTCIYTNRMRYSENNNDLLGQDVTINLIGKEDKISEVEKLLLREFRKEIGIAYI